MNAGKALLEKIRTQFYGADTAYQIVNGEVTPRVYLDSAASCLMMKPAMEASTRFLAHYSNTHSDTHYSATIANGMYTWAHHKVLRFLGASPEEYTCVFVGSGSTAAINRVAQLLRKTRPHKPGVLISLMEHHSNDLPHRVHHDFAEHVGCEGEGVDLGSISVTGLETLLDKHLGMINYVAVTAASNVTGIANPIHEVARLAHDKDALIVVDASQILAHKPLSVHSNDGDTRASLDVVVFSGHKVYAPGSPGVLVIRKSLLAAADPCEFGGGMVDRVFKTEFSVSRALPDREEAGTPNILGAVNLAMALDVMSRIGMEVIEAHEHDILGALFDGLLAIDGITIYGSKNLARYSRTATISFNLAGVDHGLLAAILNDHFNLALRNECFCAHPYVREMILHELWELDPDMPEHEVEAKKGMVRASFGLNNCLADVHKLIDALKAVAANTELYIQQYALDEKGNYRHKELRYDWSRYFSPEAILDSVL